MLWVRGSFKTSRRARGGVVSAKRWSESKKAGAYFEATNSTMSQVPAHAAAAVLYVAQWSRS